MSFWWRIFNVFSLSFVEQIQINYSLGHFLYVVFLRDGGVLALGHLWVLGSNLHFWHHLGHAEWLKRNIHWELYFVLLDSLALKTLVSISQNGLSPITINKQIDNHLNRHIINASISLSSLSFWWMLPSIVPPLHKEFSVALQICVLLPHSSLPLFQSLNRTGSWVFLLGLPDVTRIPLRSWQLFPSTVLMSVSFPWMML